MAPKEPAQGIDAKLLADVIALALTTLRIPPGSPHRDDLDSDGRLAIALHVMNGGRQDKALLVKIAKCAMVNWQRSNRERLRTEVAALAGVEPAEDIWQRVPDAPPTPKKTRKRESFQWATRTFYNSGHFFAQSKVQYAEQPDPDGPDWAEFQLEQDIRELAYEEASPAEIVRRLSNRYEDQDLASKLPLPKVLAILREQAAWERESESRRLDCKIFELAELGSNQTQIGDALGISRVAVHKRIKQIEARYQTWLR